MLLKSVYQGIWKPQGLYDAEYMMSITLGAIAQARTLKPNIVVDKKDRLENSGKDGECSS